MEELVQIERNPEQADCYAENFWRTRQGPLDWNFDIFRNAIPCFLQTTGLLKVLENAGNTWRD